METNRFLLTEPKQNYLTSQDLNDILFEKSVTFLKFLLGIGLVVFGLWLAYNDTELYPQASPVFNMVIITNIISSFMFVIIGAIVFMLQVLKWLDEWVEENL